MEVRSVAEFQKNAEEYVSSLKQNRTPSYSLSTDMLKSSYRTPRAIGSSSRVWNVPRL